ncbi:MAG: hypothetical protein HW416_1357 [Chloroflexi bacterium]|nr:hypothetical protein [Chloroflexota bacterium]
MALTEQDRYTLSRMRGCYSNCHGDFEETTGMVSSALNMSAKELVATLARIRGESVDDPEYQELRPFWPEDWPM